MNKVRKTLVVVFSALFVLCMALFAVGCGDTNSAKTPDESKSAYSVSVDVNDPSLGKYTLTAANSGDAYVQGTAVTVTVEPNEDYEASLVVNGEEVALTDNAYTFTVEGDTDLQVNYSYKYVAYTNITAGKGTVTLSDPADGSAKYAKGEEVTVTVEPAEHYELKSLRINNDYVSLTDGEVKFQITGKTYVFAEFVALHTVTVENEEAKGTVAMRANGKTVESGVELAEGTEVELTVTPMGGNTVKAVYVAGAWTPLDEAGKATFTLQKNSIVEVVYDTYYTVTLPEETEGGTVTLSEEAATLGYLDGTTLTLTVEPAEGYVVTSFKVTVGGKAEDAKLNFGKYTFTVTADVTIEVEFETKETALTYNVNIAYSNNSYGAATLSEDANDDGTYSYGTELVLEVKPSDGYKVSYVTVNGNKVEAQEDGTYAITVTEDIDIYVCFAKAERFNVRVEMYGLKGATATLQIGEEGAVIEPVEGDQFIKAQCYEGQDLIIAVTLGELEEGMQLYYYTNDSARELYKGKAILIENVTGDVTVRLAAEAPTAPTLKPVVTTVDSEASELEVNYDMKKIAKFELVDGIYTLTLSDPDEVEGHIFNGWTVTLNGEALTPDETTGVYTFDYNDEGMEIALTADWLETVTVTLPEKADEGTVTLTLDGPYEDCVKYYTSVTITVTPTKDYRVKTITLTQGDTETVLPFNAGGAQTCTIENIDADVTVTVEYQAIYTYTYSKPAHAFFTIEALDKKKDFLEYDAETSTYTFDEASDYVITFTLDEDDYKFTSITVNGTPVDLSGEDYIYTGKLSHAATPETSIIDVVAKKLAAVTYTIKPKREDNLFSVEIRAGEELVEYGDKLVSGTQVHIHFSVPEGYEAYFTGSFGGFNVHHTNVTNMNNLTCSVTDNGLYFELEFELVPPELPLTFPTQGSTGAFPSQGTWTSSEEGSNDTLVVTEKTMTINGDPVTEFSTSSDGSFFNVTTNNAAGEERTYTLEWFGEAKGFILELIETTESAPAPAPAPTPAGRRNAAAAAEETNQPIYYVNPAYGTSYHAAYLSTDEKTLVGDGTEAAMWKFGNDSLKFSVNVVKNGEEETREAHVLLNETEATYVFAVEAGHYLFVIGTNAYDLFVGTDAITVNGDNWVHPNMSFITVNETGKPAGQSGDWYTLMNGETAVKSNSSITLGDDTTLTLTLKTPEDYTATVTVTGATLANEGNTYTLTELTANVTISITYNVVKKVIAVSGAHLEGALFLITVQTNGHFTADELKSAVKLVSGTKECAAIRADAVQGTTDKFTLQFNGIVDWEVSEEGYILTLKVNDTVIDDLTANAVTGQTMVQGDKTYTLSIADGKLVLTVSAYVAPAEYTVTVTESGKPEDTQDLWYELKKGETAVASGSKVVKDSVLTLTLKAPEGYTATVKAGETDLTAQDGVYTITVTADTTITITYTAPETPPTPSDVVITSMTNNGIGVAGDKIEISFYVNAASGITGDLLKAAQVIIGTYTQNVDSRSNITNQDGTAGIIWAVLDPANIPDGQTAIQVKIGNTTYALKITAGYGGDKSLTIGDKVYAFDLDAETPTITVSAAPTEYTVDIVEEGKVEGCSVEVKNGDATVATGTKVPTTATLKVTVTVAEGYKATVVATGGTSAKNEDGTYTITALTGNVTIKVTYAEEGAVEPAAKVTAVAGATVESAGLYIIVNTENVTDTDQVKGGIKLKFGTAFEREPVGVEAVPTVLGQYKLFFNCIVDLQIGQTYVITMTAFNETIEDLTAGAVTDKPLTYGDKKFTLSVADSQLSIKVESSQGGGEEPTIPEPPVVGGTDIANGDEGVSVTNNDWRYWNDQMWTNSRVEVSVAKMTSENSIRLWAKCVEGACDWGLQLFYNNVTDYTIGNTYKLTVTIKSETACTITVNGVQKSLAAGATETFEVEFIYRQAGVDQPISLFDMQVKVANGEYYDLTLTNIAWTEPAAAEMGDPVEGQLGTEIVEGGEGTQTDKFILWWAKAEYNLTPVDLSPEITQVYQNGKISFTYSGGDQTWSVQLFYSNTKLADNTKYFVTLKIKLTAAADVNITVNGQNVTLKAGEVNEVKVLFTNTTETTDNKGISSLDIQFPGTDILEGIDSVGIEVSDVAWYYVKGQEPQEPQEPTEKTLSFTAAKVEKDGDKAYLVLTANSTLYSEADLKSFVIFDDNKGELMVDEAKSTITTNGESTLYFDVTSLKFNDWFWMHLKINGENWTALNGNGDLYYTATVNSDEKIVFGSFSYHLTLNGGTQLILAVEEIKFQEASLLLEDGKVYYVLKVHFLDKDFAAMKTAVLYNGDTTFNVVESKIEQLTEVDEHSFVLYFDITALSAGDFYPHLKFGETAWNNGNGDVNCGAGATSSVSTDTMTYTIEVTSYNMPMLKVAAKSTAAQAEQLTSGDTLIYTATAEEIGEGAADGIAAQVDLGNGKYIQFCADGLHILSDGAEEQFGTSFSEKMTFNGAEYLVSASGNSTELLNAKKKA